MGAYKSYLIDQMENAEPDPDPPRTCSEEGCNSEIPENHIKCWHHWKRTGDEERKQLLKEDRSSSPYPMVTSTLHNMPFGRDFLGAEKVPTGILSFEFHGLNGDYYNSDDDEGY